MKRLLAILLLAVALGVASAQAVAAAAGPTVDLHHFLLRSGAQGTLQVEERLQLNNPGASLPPGKVRFFLPDGARDLAGLGENGSKFEFKDGTLVFREALPPGKTIFGFSYELPLTGAPHFILRHLSDFPTALMSILVPPQGIQVQAQRQAPDQGQPGVAVPLTDLGVSTYSGQQLRVYTAERLSPGQEVGLIVRVGSGAAAGGALSRKPPVSFHNPGHIRLWYQSPFRGINAHLFLVIVFGVPLGALVYHFVRRRKAVRKAPAESEEERFQRLRTREKILLEKLVELERQRLEQRVDEESYRTLREALKTRLVQVKLQLRQFVEEA